MLTVLHPRLLTSSISKIMGFFLFFFGPLAKIGPHDILVVVWYKGMMCEVQFHLEQVFVLKALSHAGYNVLRCQTNDARDLATLFHYPAIDLHKKDASSVYCKIDV